jgi:hypothetical protein
MMKQFSPWLMTLLSGLLGAGVVLAATGINVVPILVNNTSGAAATHVQAPFSLSSQTLVDGAWMAATGLDTDVLKSGVSTPYMPGTGRVAMLACFNNAGIDQTTACNNVIIGDVTLPATGSQVYEFAADNQFAHQWLDISTAGVGTWTIVWEYYNGTSYVALSNVTDGTTAFTVAGLHRISWNFPGATLWPKSSLHGISGYWVRARVSAFTTLSVAPLATLAYYETGRWWLFTDSIGATEQQRFDLELDTSTNQTYFNYFPHPDGISVADVAGLEPGAGGIRIDVTGYINTDAGLSRNIIYKSGAVGVTVSTTASGVLIASFESGTTETYDVANSAGDGYASGAANAVYAAVACASGNSADTNSLGQRVFNGATYNINVGFMRWDTSPIPDGATITSATLSLDIMAQVNANGRNFTLDWYDFGAAADCTDWVHDALNTAGTYTIASMTNGAVNVLPLIALTNINKAGFTGIRTHIDGDAPTGNNEIDWATWDHLTKAAPRLTVTYGGAVTLEATGVTSGVHTLTVQATGSGSAIIKVDGITKATAPYSITVSNNTSTWQMFQNNVMPYVTSAAITIAGTQKLLFQLQDLPDNQIDDLSFNGNNVVARYPDTPSGVSSSVLSLEANGAAAAAAAATGANFVAPISALPNLTTSEQNNPPTGRWFGLWDIFQFGSSMSGGAVPYHAFLIMFAFGLTMFAGIASWVALKSVHITWAIFLAGSVVFVLMGGGIWGWMIPTTFAVTGLVYIFWRRASV